METKLSDTLVKAIDRSNPFMQNLQLASRFNALVDSQGGDLEDNKEATIDASAYTEPVEITPTAGKDGMKKSTVTLSNIPQAGAKAYCWEVKKGDNIEDYLYLDIDEVPESFDSIKQISYSALESKISVGAWSAPEGYTASGTAGEDNFSYTKDSDPTDTYTVTRSAEDDLDIWS